MVADHNSFPAPLKLQVCSFLICADALKRAFVRTVHGKTHAYEVAPQPLALGFSTTPFASSIPTEVQ